jgi:hypothetical protein
MVNRTEQQATGQQRIFVNDLASFASTCKSIGNSARSVPPVRHFVVTICHGQMAFEGIRSAEPQQTYTTAIPGEWIMVNKDTNTHTHTLGIMPLAQIPGNVAFNNLTNMLSRIQHLTINIELDSPVMMVSKPEFFLADNIPRTEISTFAKEELWCQKIGELLWSASGSLSHLSSLDIVIKVHFEGVRYYLNRFLQQNPGFYPTARLVSTSDTDEMPPSHQSVTDNRRGNHFDCARHSGPSRGTLGSLAPSLSKSESQRLCGRRQSQQQLGRRRVGDAWSLGHGKSRLWRVRRLLQHASGAAVWWEWCAQGTECLGGGEGILLPVGIAQVVDRLIR